MLLLTTDGEFMNTLVGPKSNLEKEYLARVVGIIKKEDTYKIAKGVDIGGYVTRKCYCELVSIDKENNSSLVKVVLREGKYHQVKRMFESIGFPVKRLTRTRFGEITCDGLKDGEVRYLTPHEIKRLVVLANQQKRN